MDYDDFRSILRNSGVDLWTLMDTAISVASLDYGNELKDRRDGIVERLYSSMVPRCRNCEIDSMRTNNKEIKKLQQHSPVEPSIEKESSSHEGKGGSPSTPRSLDRDDDGDRSYGHSTIEDEETKILNIREHLEDPDQSEDYVISLLQNLADMDITLKALKETDIGRHVNRLRKHSSNEVRRLVKQLVRRWKDVVDEWVKLNTPGGGTANSAALIADGDSPQQNPLKSTQNVHHQVPDFAYSPNPHNGSSGSDKNHSESEPKGKAVPSRRETQTKTPVSALATASASPSPNKQREQKDSAIDPERLASARRRLQENYQEAQNAKKQRTIQVMDLHDIPKPKNSFIGKKGGFQARHW
ncbi:probable mediator of RNA polymerase II transcription subunit 26c isoform X2 [Telopea speciosissima]|uniref:probable mediator of RNA polymerase II transcription subunit 26c isoform X2 n=1 Tax=Telopea speciosissima TaxID=54955 RepID=UPI001CC41CCA|nr:probable mediator of RNA polymerase II transcription subunit 26c isoform X2 [Telopea speciosissima]